MATAYLLNLAGAAAASGESLLPVVIERAEIRHGAIELEVRNIDTIDLDGIIIATRCKNETGAPVEFFARISRSGGPFAPQATEGMKLETAVVSIPHGIRGGQEVSASVPLPAGLKDRDCGPVSLRGVF